MTPEQLGKLFNAFVGDASTTRKYGGTGLGLLISRKFLPVHGRRRPVHEGEHGKGTVFTAFVPVRVVDPAAAGLRRPRVRRSAR